MKKRLTKATKTLLKKKRKNPKPEHQCAATIFTGRGPSHDCFRKGVVHRKRKWWCKQHDPKAGAARRAKTEARWAAEAKVRGWYWKNDKLRDAIADVAIKTVKKKLGGFEIGMQVSTAVRRWMTHQKRKPQS